MGKVHKFADNIDTDIICPGKYLNISDPRELAKICLAGYEQGYAKKISLGDVFVAGRNFGCGSSREHAPIAIRAAGVSCIIAESFARIFYRNAINIGLPVLESAEAVSGTDAGDDVEIQLADGIINNLTKGRVFHFIPYSSAIMKIIQAGGLERYYENKN